MDNWKIKQTVDLQRGYPPLVVWPETLMVAGDKNAHTIELTVLDKGEKADLSGCTVIAWFIRQLPKDSTDAATIMVSGSISENVASVTLNASCYAVPCSLRCVLRISKGEQTLTACDIFFTVRDGVGTKIVDPDGSIPNIEELLAEFTTMRNLESSVSAAEAERVAAETSRVSAESTRESNETTRQSNESARVANEQERQSLLTSLTAAGTAAAEAAQNANEKATLANEKATLADTNAKAAETAAKKANTATTEAQKIIDEADDKFSTMDAALLTKVDDAYVSEDGFLYLTSNNEVVAGPLGPFGTGGSGTGPSIEYTISLSNLLESRVLSTSGNEAVNLKFNYKSVDSDENDDGDGVGTITVNGTKAATISVAQGANTVDVSKYLVAGSNTLKIKVENSEGSSRTLTYSVTVITLTLTTTFDDMATYTGAVVFSYTVTGSGTKTVHFAIDGTEIGTEEVTSSGRSRSYSIAAQTVGAHILTVYAEVTTNGVTVQSNTLTIGMMWVSSSMSAPSIMSTFSKTTATQGEILTIPYMVYDPLNESTSITLTILNADGTSYSSKSITVDRTKQTWVIQNYPEGAITFRITCGATSLSKTVTVSASGTVIEPITDALALLFDPSGRSNLETNPASWSSGDIAATFNGVGFSAADGWMTDTEGAALLRLLPGGEMTIPFKLFANDARTSGATVEVEMATHNVRDYDTVVLSCLSGGRGFKIASQYAEIKSEQSELSMQFKEDEKVRVSFVIEPRNLHRLIYVYVDGIMCGAIQYPADDNFAQSTPVGLTIGATSSGIDIYKIRMYTKGLTRHEVLDNYIADRPLLSDRMNASSRNDIFDLAEDIVVSKLPSTLPYMIIKCEELPLYKGNKKTCEIEYVNPADTARSFTASGVQIDVQGTSSAGYKKKNWKLKFNSGVTYTANAETAESYLLREDSIPANVFCMKADVASSEGTNNVELVRLYNDTVPYQTPPQQNNSKVRVGIDGLPCVIFWQNTATNEVRFWGKYNFNFDKSAEAVYGLTTGCESWEVKNNTSNRVLFKSSDFSDSGWLDDFEARYPDGNENYTNLKALCDWLVSTDRTAATGTALASSVTYDETTYTQDTAAYRLAKFKAEFEQHFVKTPTLFYYLFTEVFLMVDSRAKNFFPTTFDGTHWLPFPYDMDTAVGINNEGQLVFDYDLEDTDKVSGNNVFNGQDSVLWCNVRDAFQSDIASMYKTLRNGTKFNYAEVVRRYAEHQAVWPEAVWNEDSWEKYLEPLENDNDGSYLTMLQGNKASQREWWLYNGFRYRDSKYQTGDAANNLITLRCYAVGDITVTPYSHIWPRIKYGSYTVTKRGKRNVPCKLDNPMDTMNDTEVYIYSADRLAAIGDLSPVQVGFANFSMATKLQSLKLGDGNSSYSNTHLTELYTGNNELLTSLDVQNCSALAMTVDLSGCVGIETIKAKGSAVTGFTLPVGGKLKTLELPATVTNLTIRDQAQFTTLSMEGYTALATLRVENTKNIPYEAIINGATALDRVRLIGVEWTATSSDTLQTSITKLKTCKGLDAAGGNTPLAVVTGKVYVPSVTAELLAEINESFPNLVVVANGVPQYIVRYLNWDNTVLYRAVVAAGGNATNPVTAGSITAPTREATEDTRYTFKDFGTLPTNVQNNVSVVAQYTETYRVRFMNGDAVFDTQWIVSGGNATAPSTNPTKASTAQYTYTFKSWSGSYTNVTAPVDISATFTSTVRTYTVKFYNDTTLLQTVTVAYGNNATYTGDTPVSPDGSADDGYEFTGWLPSPNNIKADTNCYAQYTSPVQVVEITDDWETIRKNVAAGIYKTQYSIGNYKSLDLGSEGTVTMQIVAMDADKMADGSTAPITWITRELLKNLAYMNRRELAGNSTDGYTEGTGTIGGWEKCEMRTYLKTTIKPLIPEAVRKQIIPVSKTSCAYNTTGSIFQQTTIDDVWIPSVRELSRTSVYDAIETTGPLYTSVYKDKASRIKKTAGKEDAYNWVLRTAVYVKFFADVTTSGSLYISNSNVPSDIAIGFCTGADTISDTWEEIIASMDDGTYSTKYSVGDTKLINLGSEGIVCATLVGIDVDDLADGSGKAKMSWITEELLNTSHRMNPEPVGNSTDGYTEGTGTIGGWEKCEMRTYLKTTIKPLIPEVVRNRIATVTKTQEAFDTSGTKFTQTTQDDVWLPSSDELSDNLFYKNIFISERRKKKYGDSNYLMWWCRSSYNVNSFSVVFSTGSVSATMSSLSGGVALGFCLN